MDPIVLLAVVVGGLYLVSSKKGATAPAGATTAGQGPKCGGVGGFIKGHLGRKNAIAPKVIQGVASNYGVPIPSGAAKEIAKYADVLSVSNKVEGFIDDKLGNALCNLDPLQAAAAGAKFVAHEVVAGAKYVGGKIVEGAEAVGSGAAFVGKEIGSGVSTAAHAAANAAAAGAKFSAGIIKNPLSGVQPLASIGTKVATAPLALGSRATSAVYNALPTPLKYAAAPAVIPAKVTAKVATTVIKGAGTVVAGAGRTLSSGVKSAEHAVSSVASGIGHALGF